MPKVGDIYESNGVLYAIISINPEQSDFRVQTPDGRLQRWTVEELDKAKLFAKPERDWAFVIRKSVNWGAVKEVRIPRLGDKPLEPLKDWFTLNDLAVHLNPKLGILRGDIIVVTCANGRQQKCEVTAVFGTIGQRVARKTKKERKDETVYDLIFSGTFDFDG